MSWFERRDRFLKRGRAGQPGEMVSAAWLEDERLSEPSWRHRNAAGQAAGVILGYFGDLVVGSIDDRHIVTVAGSRGGKGVSLIVPNLLFYDGSVVAIDPKGELAAITARARRDKGQNVIVLDPFGASGVSGAISSYNPLDELDIASPDVIDDAAQIADGLITPSENEPHFTDSARILVTALILLTLSLPAVSRVTKQPERRDLRTVWDLLSGTHPEIVDIMGLQKVGPRKALFAIMANLVVESKDSSGQRFVLRSVTDAVQSAGRNFAEVPEKELGSIYSTAMTQLQFLQSERMKDVLASSELRLSQLKTEKTTLYLCLPATRMGTHARWLRVIINLSLVAFERVTSKPDIPVLMVLDEFAVLGQMKSIERAAGFIAGFGVRLWVVLQDLTQLSGLYRNGWETFLGNAGVATFWSNSDKFTLNYLSERMGQTTVTVDRPVEVTPQQRFSGAATSREDHRVQRLAAADELEQMLDRSELNMLVRVAGKPPVVIERMIYHDQSDSNFHGLYDQRKDGGQK